MRLCLCPTQNVGSFARLVLSCSSSTDAEHFWAVLSLQVNITNEEDVIVEQKEGTRTSHAGNDTHVAAVQRARQVCQHIARPGIHSCRATPSTAATDTHTEALVHPLAKQARY